MRRFLRAAGSWTVGILCFALVCLAVGRFFPQEVNGISLKFRRFAPRKDNFDTLFVGSSRIYHGVDPVTFDRTMREHGHATHSFNFAMDGLNTAEGFGLVRHVLGLHPRKLKTIFFEAQATIAAGTPTDAGAVKVRDVYWRDWPSVVDGTRIFAQGLAWPRGVLPGAPFSVQRWQDLGPTFLATARLWFRNFTHVGSGMDILHGAIAHLPPREKLPKPQTDRLPPDWDGYFAMARPMEGKTLETYRKAMANLQRRAAPHEPDPLMRSELARFVREMAAKNIKVVFVEPPSLMAARGSAVHVPSGVPLFAYTDVLRYPEFYTEEDRLDTEHLNGRGAEIFSRTLAKDYSASLAGAAR